MSDFSDINWHELSSRNKLSDFSIIYCFLVKYVIYISNMNELLPHPLLCWYATSGAGGLRRGNQLILGNAQQYSDIKFLNILRYGLGRTDLFPDFSGDVLYDVPPTHVGKFRLLHSGYSSFSQLICELNIAFFELCWFSTTTDTKRTKEILRNFTCSYQKHIIVQLTKLQIDIWI